jgi:putative methyltransferase (TIGR04325 family)
LKKRVNGLRSIFKSLLPPICIYIAKKIFIKGNSVFVSYPNWEEAERASEGYDNNDIITKTKESAKLVFDGKVVYERDSVIYNEIQYSYPLLASLLLAAACSNTLRVIDVGGAFGTTYQQNRRFLSKLQTSCEWRIVEQKKIVSIGKKEFKNRNLSFHETLESANEDGADIVLFGGSICYIPNPYDYLEKVKATKVPFIILDRTPITDKLQDTFAVQHTPTEIYKASYPIRNFNYSNIIKSLEDEYELIEKWISDQQPDLNTTAMGFVFKRK